MIEGFIAGKLANKMFEKDVFKIVKRHAFWGALIIIHPLFGLVWICFVAILCICIVQYAKNRYGVEI